MKEIFYYYDLKNECFIKTDISKIETTHIKVLSKEQFDNKKSFIDSLKK